MKEAMDMGKIWRILLLGLGVLISTTAYAYSYGLQTYTSDLEQKAEEVLKNAEIREIYSYRFDTTHCILLKDGKVVGVIWKGTKDGVSIGTIVQTKWGAKAMLTKNGEVVGQLFIEGLPGHGHASGEMRNTFQSQCTCGSHVNGYGGGYRHGHNYAGE